MKQSLDDNVGDKQGLARASGLEALPYSNINRLFLLIINLSEAARFRLVAVPIVAATIAFWSRCKACNSHLENPCQIGAQMFLLLPSVAQRSKTLSTVLSVNIDSFDEALETIAAQLHAGRGFNFFTLNLDHLVKLRTDPRFQAAYRSADFISADGWPIVWLLRHHDHRVQRVTGADLVEPLCARVSNDGLHVYFIGPGRESLTEAVKVLRRRYPNLTISGADSPVLAYDFSDEMVDQLAERINNSGAQLCFLSLGAPKQEVLAEALHRKCPHVGFLCVGAALDFISGHHVRAPRFIQQLRGEWLWRMMSDPIRLAPRYAKCLTLLLEIDWGGRNLGELPK